MQAVKDFLNRHPVLAQWIVLAVGMVIILIWAAKDQNFLPQQWAALIISTIVLAGLCVWIINWE